MMRILKVQSYYTSSQAVDYLRHIGFRNVPSIQALENDTFEKTLQNLTIIMRLHLTTFPCENTAMHYSEHHVMDITPQGLFERMVAQKKGYGSYCFGQNGLMLGMLRALGYRVYSGSGRVNVSPDGSLVVLSNVSHMVLFVQPDEVLSVPSTGLPSSTPTYIVDVGYGHHGLARPIPLAEGIIVRGSAPPEEHRLVRDRHPEFSSEPWPITHADGAINDFGLEWRLEFRCGSHQPEWRVLYQFSTAESYAVDYDAQNFAVSQRHGAGPFWVTVIGIKQFFVDNPNTSLDARGGESGHGDTEDYRYSEDTPIGRFVLNGTRIDRRIGDKSETIEVVNNDLERVKALKQWFGLDIPEEDARWIKGRAAELPN